MRSAKSSSKGLQSTMTLNSKSLNSSPESKTTSFRCSKSIQGQIKVMQTKKDRKISEHYKKVNVIRSNLLMMTNNDITYKQKFFDEISMSSSICICQEFDVTSRESNHGSAEVNLVPSENTEIYMSNSSAENFKLLYCSPHKLDAIAKKDSSKQLNYELFNIKRDFKLINKNSGLEAKKPFAKKLSSIAMALRGNDLNKSKMNDLQLLSQMIQRTKVEGYLKRDSASNISNSTKYLSDNNFKKSCFRECNSIRHPGKIVKSSQTLSTDVLTKVCSPSTLVELRGKGKSNKPYSSLLNLIPCGINPPIA